MGGLSEKSGVEARGAAIRVFLVKVVLTSTVLVAPVISVSRLLLPLIVVSPSTACSWA